MTPEDLTRVQSSWTNFVHARTRVLAVLAEWFEPVARPTFSAARRAEWLFEAVEELVDLLSAPSCLADHARRLAQTWPDPRRAPCFAIEGRAWMGAASACLAEWSPSLERAWRQAWLLLSDVLAAETLSPFCDDEI